MLKGKTQSFFEMQRFVVLEMDKIKIQSNLVFDKRLGDLIGFMDLGDLMVNFACVEEENFGNSCSSLSLYGFKACHFLSPDTVPHIIPTNASILVRSRY